MRTTRGSSTELWKGRRRRRSEPPIRRRLLDSRRYTLGFAFFYFSLLRSFLSRRCLRQKHAADAGWTCGDTKSKGISCDCLCRRHWLSLYFLAAPRLERSVRARLSALRPERRNVHLPGGPLASPWGGTPLPNEEPSSSMSVWEHLTLVSPEIPCTGGCVCVSSLKETMAWQYHTPIKYTTQEDNCLRYRFPFSCDQHGIRDHQGLGVRALNSFRIRTRNYIVLKWL